GGTVLSYILGQYLSRNTGSVALLGACYMFLAAVMIPVWPVLTEQSPVHLESFVRVLIAIVGLFVLGVVAAMIAGLVGMLDGLVCGLASGVVIGILAQWVLPRTLPPARYQVVFRAVGVITSLIASLATLSLLLTWMFSGFTTSNVVISSFSLVVLPSLIAAIPNWWIGARIARWYAGKVREPDGGSAEEMAE
ncbi:MAG TPA: hypothetical protein VEY08_17770, partial [Chloroflexia bacterium]|nr:hypothetical protein [Chloroflexia bacterium]